MNYLILFIAGGAGLAVGYYFARRKRGVILEQSRAKAENLEKILELFEINERITNNDVEKLLNTSDSTVGRYLDELESEDKIVQHGKTGRSVFYTLK